MTRIGSTATFVYPSEFSEVDGHKAHSGQVVAVIGKGPDFAAHEADGDALWAVQADDGWTGTAFESELTF